MTFNREDEPTWPGEAEGVDDAVSALRRRLLTRFEEWLDSVLLDSEAPPSGVDAGLLSELEFNAGRSEDLAGRECDLYGLWSSMTGLAQEVKVQGRTFAGLTEALDSQDAAAKKREGREEAVLGHARKTQVEVLLDLRDRLARGLESAERHLKGTRSARPGRLRRLLRLDVRRLSHLVDVGESLVKGYVLTLDRLEEVLDGLGIEEVGRAGERFDPRLMSAVDVEEAPGVPDGTVLEVLRRGYCWNGRLFRPAEVKVARNRPGPAGRAGGLKETTGDSNE